MELSFRLLILKKCDSKIYAGLQASLFDFLTVDHMRNLLLTSFVCLSGRILEN